MQTGSAPSLSQFWRNAVPTHLEWHSFAGGKAEGHGRDHKGKKAQQEPEP